VRILILHNRYRQPGGEDVLVQAQAALLKERGHEVRVFEKDNKIIDSYGLFRKALLFFNTAENTSAEHDVARIVAEFKPDVAHVHNTLPLLSPSVYRPLKKAGVKVIQHLHNYRLVCPAGTLYRDGKHCQLCVDGSLKNAVEHRCWNHSKLATLAVTRMLDRHRRAKTWHRLVDLFVASNHTMSTVLVEKGILPADKIIVQGNFSNTPLPEQNSDLGFFVFIGRLTPEKGLATLLKSVESFPENTLRIIGDAPSETPASLNLETPFSATQHAKPYSFLGRKPIPETLKILSQSRALVVPSEWQEPFGLSILDAMAMAKPVIASRVAGPAEIIQEGVTGLLFEPGNVKELEACLRRLHDDPQLAHSLGQAGRQRYEKEYSAEAGYQNLLANYKRLGLPKTPESFKG
jgi:glycosyltransferase involved in cell wall biosynthesis